MSAAEGENADFYVTGFYQLFDAGDNGGAGGNYIVDYQEVLASNGGTIDELKG